MKPDFPFLANNDPVCPPGLLQKAQSRPTPRVALVNAGGETALNGLREAVDLSLAEPVLIGDRDKIARTAEAIDWDITPYRIEHAPEAGAAPRAASLARNGEVDSIMKGQIHTSTFLKGLLPSSAGLRDPGARCGHVFHITAPGSERPLLLTDAALNVDPDLTTRQDCLKHAVAMARAIVVENIKAGCLAPTEDVVPSVSITGEAAQIKDWAATALPDITVEGPIALDLMFSKDAAEVKGYASDIPGDVDIMVMPNITSGNAVAKLMILGMGCCAGGLVMGLKVPVLLTSRSQKSAARICSAALGAIMAGAS